MTRLLIAAALGVTALTAALPAAAQGVDAREGRQQGRIYQGVRSGELTGREAGRLERQEGRLEGAEARMRFRDGGRLNHWQRARLEHRENRLSRHIYRAKHNFRHY